ILDRRWKWQYGNPISLHANIQISQATRQSLQRAIVDATGGDLPLDERFVKSARDLAVLCLQALAEKKYDVSQVSDAVAMPVDWEYDNPARCLQQVLDAVGCRVVLRLDNSILCAKTGVGQTLPAVPVLDGNISVKTSNRPDSIQLVCGPTRYQDYFVLE